MAKENAESMFNAYNEQGPNPWKTWDGKDVPRWDALNDQVRAKWRAAAKVPFLNEDVDTEPSPEQKAQMEKALLLKLGNEGALGFGGAIDALKRGLRVTRKGWNRAGMWLELQVPDAHSKMGQPYIFITPTSECRVPWVASQPDMLADDWSLVGWGEASRP